MRKGLVGAEAGAEARRAEGPGGGADTLHIHYPSGALKEHNLGQYGYSHVWELHSVKTVPIDDIIGSNDVTKMAAASASMGGASPVAKDAVYCEHTYTPHRGCDIIASGAGGPYHRRGDHIYGGGIPQELGTPSSRNCDVTSAYDDLDPEVNDNTQNNNTLDLQQDVHVVS